MKSKKLRGQLQQKDEAYKEAQEQAAATEVFLLPSEAGYLQAEEMERTCRITQQQIVDAVDIQSRRNVMDIELDQLGPYMLSYSLTGQYVARPVSCGYGGDVPSDVAYGLTDTFSLLGRKDMYL